MLGPTLMLVAVLLLTTTVAVTGIGAFARASMASAAQTAIRSGFSDALEHYQNDIYRRLLPEYNARFVPNTADGTYTDVAQVGVLPDLRDTRKLVPAQVPYVDPVETQAGTLWVTEDVANTTVTPPSCTGVAAVGNTDTAVQAQCSPWVGESRLSGIATITVFTGPPYRSDSAVVARRTQTFTLRVFGDPPFSALAGVKDGNAREPISWDVTAAGAHEGDTGGYAPAQGTTTANAPSVPGDTTIHVYYECRGPCPNGPDPPGDDPRNRRWGNGNAAVAPGATLR